MVELQDCGEVLHANDNIYLAQVQVGLMHRPEITYYQSSHSNIICLVFCNI